jgi:hypothetical protein
MQLQPFRRRSAFTATRRVPSATPPCRHRRTSASASTAVGLNSPSLTPGSPPAGSAPTKSSPPLRQRPRLRPSTPCASLLDHSLSAAGVEPPRFALNYCPVNFSRIPKTQRPPVDSGGLQHFRPLALLRDHNPTKPAAGDTPRYRIAPSTIGSDHPGQIPILRSR